MSTVNNANNIKPANHRKAKKGIGWIFVGGAFLLLGGLLLARELHAPVPDWIIGWPILVILFGLNVLIRSRLRDLGGFLVLGVGLFFMAGDIWPELNIGRFAFPVIILTLGLLIILTTKFPAINRFQRRDEFADADDTKTNRFPQDPAADATGVSETNNFRTGNIGRKGETRGSDDIQQSDNARQSGNTRQPGHSSQSDHTSQSRNIGQPGNTGQPAYVHDASDRSQGAFTGEEFSTGQTGQSGQYGDKVLPHYFREENLEIVSVFSANNKKVYSKNFTGGEVVCVFGGSEIDLMNADITQGPIELEVVCIFGGATLYIPPNWLVIPEMGSVFGGIDDKRKSVIPDSNKIITIKGVCVFGGMEIKSRVIN